MNKLEKTTKSFRTCANRGFHLKFKNGWVVSIQIGAGNYCDNYNLVYDGIEVFEKRPDLESMTAEVWAWNEKGNYPEYPLGYQTMEEVLKFINKIKRKKK